MELPINVYIQILVPLSISLHFMFQKEKIDIFFFARFINEFLDAINLILLNILYVQIEYFN